MNSKCNVDSNFRIVLPNMKGVIIFFMFLFLCMPYAFSQSNTVRGKVTDPSGESLVGVSVQVENTSNGIATDANGDYSLNNIPSNGVLVFSYIGMETQRVSVNNRTVIDVVLLEDSELLDEVVVIGYGTVKKSDLTGAVSVVKTEDFANRALTSVGDALQGAAAGVSVRSTGSLGGLPSIQIRGTGNLTNTDPLYVIDGLPTNNNVGFNVNDIETIQILKDASAAAIYGSRAANGVIIITTKSGQEGKTKIDFSSQVAFQNMRQLDFINGDEWRSTMTQVYQNGLDKGNSPTSAAIPAFWKHNTDWQDEFMKTGIQQEYNLGISGGGKDSKYRISFGLMDNSGYYIGRSMSRFTTSVNSQFKRGIFTIGESVQFGRTGNKSHSNTSLDNVVNIIPIIAVKDAEFGKNGWGYGNRNYAYSNAYNVVATANDSNGFSKNENLYLRASAWVEAKLTDWITYKLNLGATITDNDSHSWSTGYQYAYGFTDLASNASASASRNSTYLIENTVNINKKLQKHNISAVLGQSFQDSPSRSLGSGRQDLISSASGAYLQNVSGGTTLSTATGTSSRYSLISYFGRVNYDYNGKYLLQATVRHDGTSRFAKGNRWGTFPSVSLGWRISQEDFFDVSWIDDLKLRANYGTLGSQNVGNYDHLSLMNSYTGYAYTGGTTLITGQAITDVANSNIKWETKTTTNIGLDMTFLNNRLQTSVEYYNSQSKDVLYTQSILKTVGSVSNPVVNSASIENKGIELSLNWRDKISQDWSYSVGVNLSHNKNTLKGLGYGVDSYDGSTTLSKVGESIGLFYLVKTDGIYQTDAEAAADGLINNARAGDIKYIDFNGSKTITQDDRQLLTDKSPWPKLEGSLNINVSYKNWGMQLFGFGEFFKWVRNGTRQSNDQVTGQSQISRAYYDNVWSESNKHNDVRYPKTAWNYTFNDLNYTDRWIERGDFFKFSTIALSYNYKATGLLSTVMESARLTITAQNFLCLTKFSGYDPDFSGGMFTPGNVSNSTTPNPKSLIFGLNLSF